MHVTRALTPVNGLTEEGSSSFLHRVAACSTGRGQPGRVFGFGMARSESG